MFDNSSEVRRWGGDRGDTTHRLNYNLSPEAVVFDLGGYKGDWAHQIFTKFNCNVYIFEPIPSLYEGIKNRFSTNPKITPYCIGLSNLTGEKPIYLSNDASSTHLKSGTSEMVNFMSINEFIQANDIQKIDLMKINIEGDEYDVMDCLIEHNLLNKISHFQIQFHEFPDYETRRNNIREHLSKSFTEEFCYEYVWEGWKQKAI